jgi:adenylosuccinate synthase
MENPAGVDSAKVLAIMGAQWGDEGKGKLVDVLGARFDVIARCAGGSNAGHTVIVGFTKFAFHLLPSGVLHEQAICVLGNGVVIHLPTFFQELDSLTQKGVSYEGRIKISDRAHLVFDFHQELDAKMEEEAKKGSKDNSIGTTRKGIGPCYTSKIARMGIRVGDLRYEESLHRKLENLLSFSRKTFPDLAAGLSVDDEVRKYVREYLPRIAPMITDTVHYLNDAIRKGKRVMIEGANATMLDIDFGTYPYVTSSSASIGGACTGLGIAPTKINSVVGIVKAYTTRVGAGPFPTELDNELGERLRSQGHEYGTTTGRPRRCGWLDIVALKYSHDINDFSVVNLTKLDVLTGFDEIKIGVAYKIDGQVTEEFPSNLELLEKVEIVYETMPGWKQDLGAIRRFEDLPQEAQKYVERIEELSGLKIGWIGVGPDREAIALRKV